MEYTVVFSKRRTLSAEVLRDGTVLVRAPYYCSRRTIDSFVYSKESLLLKRMDEIRSLPEIPAVTIQEAEILREKTRSFVLERLKVWQAITQIPYGNVTITKARGRFGSCSAKGDLSFSLFLALCDEHLADYVVLHELCHVREHNHSVAFYDLVESYMPDRKIREKKLKKIILPEIVE